MPTFEVQRKAAELERQLAMLTGHQRARVKPYGKHLLIQMRRDGGDDNDRSEERRGGKECRL